MVIVEVNRVCNESCAGFASEPDGLEISNRFHAANRDELGNTEKMALRDQVLGRFVMTSDN